MDNISSVEQKVAEHREWRRRERMEDLRAARGDIVEALARYCQEVTRDGENEEIEMPEPGLAALVRAFVRIDGALLYLQDDPEHDEALRHFVTQDVQKSRGAAS